MIFCRPGEMKLGEMGEMVVVVRVIVGGRYIREHKLISRLTSFCSKKFKYNRKRIFFTPNPVYDFYFWPHIQIHWYYYSYLGLRLVFSWCMWKVSCNSGASGLPWFRNKITWYGVLVWNQFRFRMYNSVSTVFHISRWVKYFIHYLLPLLTEISQWKFLANVRYTLRNV